MAQPYHLDHPTPLSTLQNPSWFLSAPNTAHIADHPIPTLSSPHDVILRIRYTGVCGSDVHFWAHGGLSHKIIPGKPLIMGHEASGTVHAVGPDVTRVKPGDDVAVEPGYPCRMCARCKEGRYNLCPGMRFAACPPDTHGTLTGFFRVPEDFVYSLPEGVGLQEAVLVEPLAVAVHAVKLVGVKPGDSVVVFGSGTIGLLCAAVSKAFGAKKIVAVDVLESKLEFARAYTGAEVFKPQLSDPAEKNAEMMINDYKLGEGSDIVIEASGTESSINIAIHLLRPGGSFVQAGLGKPITEFPILRMSEKELSVKGCFRYGPGDYESALTLLQLGSVSVKELVTKVFPFGKATEAWETTQRGIGIKNLIRGLEYG